MTNLFVLMIDCLRQDRLEGVHKTARTPNLDGLLGRGVSFDNTHSVGSNTTAVMGSWFTGLYPFNHGLRSFRDRKFTDDPATMASILRGHGYRTVITVTEAMADAEDLLTGFDEIERRDKKKEAIHTGYGDRVRQKLTELNRSTQPWFYFVHTCELHSDRQCDPSFVNRRSGRDFYDRALSSFDHHLTPILDEIDWDDTIVVVFGDHGDNLIWEPRTEFASKVMNRLRGDGRVSALWWLRDAFVKAGLYGPWKAILRHNFLFHHDYHVYRFLTHSPLMVIAPGNTIQSRTDLPVSSIDLLPTLLDLLDVRLASNVDGMSFAPVIRGETIAEPQRALYQEVVTDFVLRGRDPSQLRIPLLHALVQDNWKLVNSPLDKNIKPELYNLTDDPEERRNLYPRLSKGPLVESLQNQLAMVAPDAGNGAATINALGAVGAPA
jgi:arylsulfatase A-like enzyme